MLSDVLRAVKANTDLTWETTGGDIVLFLKEKRPGVTVYTETQGEVLDHPNLVTFRTKESEKNANYPGSVRSSVTHRHEVDTTMNDGTTQKTPITVKIEVVAAKGVQTPAGVREIVEKTMALFRYDEANMALAYGQQ